MQTSGRKHTCLQQTNLFARKQHLQLLHINVLNLHCVCVCACVCVCTDAAPARKGRNLLDEYNWMMKHVTENPANKANICKTLVD